MKDTGNPPSRLLSGDHRDLDERFEEFRTTPNSHTRRRCELFDRFATDLCRHIEVEERLLFPTFGEGDSSRRSMVELMLGEHRRIEEALQAIRHRLEAVTPSTEDLELELLNVLWAHNAREEESVYPWLDVHLPDDVARAVDRELHEPEARRSAGSSDQLPP